MSVLIKGMEMPTAGYVDVRLFADGRATTATGESPFYKEMPLISVPDHGRLIDADAFEDFIRKDWDKNDHWIADVVYSRPTIIPAEEGE